MPMGIPWHNGDILVQTIYWHGDTGIQGYNCKCATNINIPFLLSWVWFQLKQPTAHRSYMVVVESAKRTSPGEGGEPESSHGVCFPNPVWAKILSTQLATYFRIHCVCSSILGGTKFDPYQNRAFCGWFFDIARAICDQFVPGTFRISLLRWKQRFCEWDWPCHSSYILSWNVFVSDVMLQVKQI